MILHGTSVITRSVLVVGLFLMLCGCSKKPALGKVKGRVTSGNEPIAQGTITFENAAAGIAVNAALDADGGFEIRTHEGAGLPPGEYVVAVHPGGTMKDGSETPLAGKNVPPPNPPNAKILEKFHDTATSPLRAVVKSGENPPYLFDLAN